MTVAEDVYTTRVTGEPRVVERPDPVFWGGSRSAEYTDFERRGFLQRERVIGDSDVSTCLAEIDRIQHDPALRDDERIVREGDSVAVRSIFDILELSDAVRRVVEASGAYDLARDILGSDVYVHQSRLNYKPGFQGGAFYWHSDFETWHAEDGMPLPRAVSASIALTENTQYNGPLMIMPGTQRYFVQCAGATPDDFYRESLVTTMPRVGVPSEDAITDMWRRHGIEVLTGGAGSMTMFDCNALHASGGNISPMPRANVFVVFNSVENVVQAPFSGSAPRPSFLAKRPA
ncbi:ectoine hydroxylase [Rhodococcus sp. SGAir0479]|uniref:ectoine hydroxylase n=1 Tax=Rhodococcus sp. SGAir0479 TaxID=2567884 RepID=UPI0010CD51DA|nr:ectoine hydroxylase [Rhodococcus sp. SGAir0479]QCQ89751.1 ectoine hydroxylase [Rhodococcus sp. SGAir0479]